MRGRVQLGLSRVAWLIATVTPRPLPAFFPAPCSLRLGLPAA